MPCRCGIVDIAHEDTFKTSAFKPDMVGAVDLNHSASMVLPRSPLTMRFLLPVFLPFTCLYEPHPYCLIADSYVLIFSELLSQQDWTEADIVGIIESDNPLVQGELKFSAYFSHLSRLVQTIILDHFFAQLSRATCGIIRLLAHTVIHGNGKIASCDKIRQNEIRSRNSTLSGIFRC